MRYAILMFLVILFSTQIGRSQSPSDFFAKADSFFKSYVKDGRVDYRAIKENPAELNMLIEISKGISITKDNTAEYKAFWINGYNLLVIKSIVENYPVKSPLEVSGFFDESKCNIGGKDITLNDIENKLLRKNFPSEPRFHFVLVCAGLGCPPIIDEAYMPKTLDAQLEAQTKLALNNPDFIKVNKNKAQISQIFEWYNEDFTKNGQTLVEFINTYRINKLPANTEISFYTYDWTLNAIE